MEYFKYDPEKLRAYTTELNSHAGGSRKTKRSRSNKRNNKRNNKRTNKKLNKRSKKI
jgi:hypothetical protein